MDNDKTNAFVMKKMTFDMKFEMDVGIENRPNIQAHMSCPNHKNILTWLRLLVAFCNCSPRASQGLQQDVFCN